MQKEYRGEIKELGQIELHTPVEVMDKSVFGEMTKRQVPEEKWVGILTQVVPSYYGEDQKAMRLMLYNGREFIKVTSRDVSLKSRALKVLTGRKGTDLIKKITQFTSKDIANLMAQTTGFNSGADPEIFVEDEAGQVIPAWEFLDRKLEKGLYGVHAFWDGFQAEYVMPAHYCFSDGVDDVRKGLKMILRHARLKFPKAKLSLKSVMEIPEDMLAKAKDEYVILGCKPSLNVYGLKGTEVLEPRMLRHRFAGGHVHLGFGAKPKPQVQAMVKGIDAVAGVACVGIFAGIDDPIRRRFYGLAGEHRLPAHGLEYRTLSNAWLCHPAITHHIFDLVRMSAWATESGALRYWRADEKDILRAINGTDPDIARKIIKANELAYRKMIEWKYSLAAYATGRKDSTMEQISEVAAKLVFDGVGSVLKDPADIEHNWMLDKPDSGYQSTSIGRDDCWVGHSESANCQINKLAGNFLKNGKV